MVAAQHGMQSAPVAAWLDCSLLSGLGWSLSAAAATEAEVHPSRAGQLGSDQASMFRAGHANDFEYLLKRRVQNHDIGIW